MTNIPASTSIAPRKCATDYRPGSPSRRVLPGASQGALSGLPSVEAFLGRRCVPPPGGLRIQGASNGREYQATIRCLLLLVRGPKSQMFCCDDGLAVPLVEQQAGNPLDLVAKLVEAAKVFDLAAFLPRQGIIERCVAHQAKNAAIAAKHAKSNAATPEDDESRLSSARERHIQLLQFVD